MTTTQQNNVVKEDAPATPYPIKSDGTADINGGDLVYFDTTAKVVKSLDDATTHCATFAGLAKNGSLISPYGTKEYFPNIPVLQKGIVNLFTTVGESYSEGDALYFGADAQTVTKTDPGAGVIIGYAKLRAGITTLTGAAGVKIDMQLAPKHPSTDFA